MKFAKLYSSRIATAIWYYRTIQYCWLYRNRLKSFCSFYSPYHQLSIMPTLFLQWFLDPNIQTGPNLFGWSYSIPLFSRNIQPHLPIIHSYQEALKVSFFVLSMLSCPLSSIIIAIGLFCRLSIQHASIYPLRQLMYGWQQFSIWGSQLDYWNPKNMPRLQLVQSGIWYSYSQKGNDSKSLNYQTPQRFCVTYALVSLLC